MKKFKNHVLFFIMALLFIFITGCNNGSNANTPAPAQTPAASETTEAAPTVAPVNEAASVPSISLRFSWWGTQERHDGTQRAIDTWNEMHPETQIEGIGYGWDGYHDMLTTQFAGHTAPDIIRYTTVKAMLYGESGLMMDLAPYVDTYFANVYKDTFWNFEYVNNGVTQLMALPTGVNTAGLMYNKDKLEEFGIPEPKFNITWDELLELCKQATRDTNGDGEIDFWGMELISGNTDNFSTVFAQNGIEVFTADNRGTNLNTPKGIESMLIFDMFKPYAPNPEDISLIEGESALGSGYVAFAIGPMSAFAGYQTNSQYKMGATSYPVLKGGLEGRSTGPGQAIGINADCKYPEQAMEFLGWFLQDPEVALITGMIRGTFPSDAQNVAFMDNLDEVGRIQTEVVMFTSNLTYNGPARRIPPNGYIEWQQLYIPLHDQYAYGLITMEELCATSDEHCNYVFAELN